MKEKLLLSALFLFVLSPAVFAGKDSKKESEKSPPLPLILKEVTQKMIKDKLEKNPSTADSVEVDPFEGHLSQLPEILQNLPSWVRKFSISTGWEWEYMKKGVKYEEELHFSYKTHGSEKSKGRTLTVMDPNLQKLPGTLAKLPLLAELNIFRNGPRKPGTLKGQNKRPPAFNELMLRQKFLFPKSGDLEFREYFDFVANLYAPEAPIRPEYLEMHLDIGDRFKTGYDFQEIVPRDSIYLNRTPKSTHISLPCPGEFLDNLNKEDMKSIEAFLLQGLPVKKEHQSRELEIKLLVFDEKDLMKHLWKAATLLSEDASARVALVVKPYVRASAGLFKPHEIESMTNTSDLYRNLRYGKPPLSIFDATEKESKH